MYEKSPKKCRKLQEIVDELRACLDPSELPLQGVIALYAPVAQGLSHIKFLL